MAVLWPIVPLVGVIAIVLDPALLVTKHLVLVGIVLGSVRSSGGFQKTASDEPPH